MESKGDTISRVRGMIKGNRQDAFITDRMIYAMVLKYARLFIKRKDDSNKLGRYQSLFQNFPGVELIEVSKIEAGCIDIDTCCKFYRSEEPLPPILEGSFGPIIRTVTSVDGSTQVNRTYSKTYVQMTKSSTFKYNKEKYYWLLNGYIYFANAEWPACDIEAMWEVDITEYRCDAEDCCVDRRSEKTNIPDDLFAEIEAPVRQELLGLMQIPRDNNLDNQSILKS